jgi:hypothetical protein
LIFFFNINEGLNLTTFLGFIITSIFVFGLRPILFFFCETVKVPKDEILNLFDYIISLIIVSKKSSIIFEERFFENPKFL